MESLDFLADNVFWFFLVVASVMLLFYLFRWWPNRRIVSFRGRLLDHVNYTRRKRKLSSLGRTNLLDKVAAEHSKSMAKHRHCDHHGFDKRAALIERKSGLSYIAENCYMFPSGTYNTHIAKELVEGWLQSPGHRANLLNPDFRRTGIGIIVKKGYVYATQIFTD